MKYFYLLFLISIVFSSDSLFSDPISYNSPFTYQDIKIKNWKDIRDKDITKQDKDYSCGAASISTILSQYYGMLTTEKDVLNTLNKENSKASFEDMEKALPKMGFTGKGLATSWEQLTKLKIPVLLYVKQRKQDHFTVVSGISDTHIKISDPSLGNRVLTRGQFKEIWETRKEKGYEGKMLAILPLKSTEVKINKDFFYPPYFSRIPTDILTIRNPR